MWENRQKRCTDTNPQSRHVYPPASISYNNVFPFSRIIAISIWVYFFRWPVSTVQWRLSVLYNIQVFSSLLSHVAGRGTHTHTYIFPVQCDVHSVTINISMGTELVGQINPLSYDRVSWQIPKFVLAKHWLSIKRKALPRRKQINDFPPSSTGQPRGRNMITSSQLGNVIPTNRICIPFEK